MNKEILVTLLRKDIQELDLITNGFMEMKEYPKSIIGLAEQKAHNIQQYIEELSKLHSTLEPVQIHETEEQVLQKQEISNKIQNDDNEIIENLTEETDPTIIVEEDYAEPDLPLFDIIDPPEMELNLPIDKDFPEKIKEGEEAIEDVQKNDTRTQITENTVTLNEKLSKIDNSIGAVLGNKKVKDIKQAISIGERFLFQRELFKGNGEDMNKTLNYLNQLATYEEAHSFLTSKYGWQPDNEVAETFLQIVRRRFN